MSSEIIWVGHASFFLKSESIGLLCDPWLSGTAFNNGWSLLEEVELSKIPFENITHIWYSHEHPDHFSPSSLKLIPEKLRSQITVLFQETRDKKIIKFCKDLGFKSMELKDCQTYELGSGVSVKCGKVPYYDSWLFLKTNEYSILDLNDCLISEKADLQKLKENIGSIDILMTQFSYANWEGNPENIERRVRSASQKMSWMVSQIEHLKPKFVIPFASYVFFCHRENFYLNDKINRINDVYLRLKEIFPAIPQVVLKSGQKWEIGADHESLEVCRHYERLYSQLPERVLHESRTVSLEEIQKLAVSYVKRINAKNSVLLLTMLTLMIPFFKPIRIHIHDLDKNVEFDLRKGLVVNSSFNEKSQVSMHSESLAFIFKFDWGFDTLLVNGRFTMLSSEDEAKAMRVFTLGSLNNMGKSFSLSLFFDWSLVKKALQRFF